MSSGENKKKMSSGVTIILYIVLLIVLWYAIKVFEIRMAYKPVFDWWSKYDGDKYDVSIFNIYAAYNNWLLYYLSRLSTSPANTLNLVEIRFFVSSIMQYTYWVDDDGRGNGILMPPHIAESAMLKPGQGIQDFDDWFHKGGYSMEKPWDPKTNPKGVYPDPGSIPNWRTKIANWAGYSGDKAGDLGGVFWKDIQGMWMPNPDEADTWIQEWVKTDRHPDNFIARTGIMPDSPIIVAFINGKYNDPNTGLVLDAKAFRDVLGDKTENLGGWLGYLKGMEGSGLSSDLYWTSLYTTYSVKPNPPPGSCGDSAGGWLGAIGSALGAGVGVGALAFMGAGPLGAAALITTGVLVGGASIGSHIANVVDCNKNK